MPPESRRRSEQGRASDCVAAVRAVPRHNPGLRIIGHAIDDAAVNVEPPDQVVELREALADGEVHQVLPVRIIAKSVQVTTPNALFLTLFSATTA